MKSDKSVTAIELGAHLDIDERGVRGLAARGILPRSGRGRWNLDTSRVAYIRHLREMAAGRASTGEFDIVQERARLAAMQADKTGIQIQVLRAQMVPIDEVERRWTGAVVSARTLLRSIPAKVAPRVAGLDAEQAQELLLTEVDDALNALASGGKAGSPPKRAKRKAPPRRPRGKGRRKVGPATKAQRKRVG